MAERFGVRSGELVVIKLKGTGAVLGLFRVLDDGVFEDLLRVVQRPGECRVAVEDNVACLGFNDGWYVELGGGFLPEGQRVEVGLVRDGVQLFPRE